MYQLKIQIPGAVLTVEREDRVPDLNDIRAAGISIGQIMTVNHSRIPAGVGRATLPLRDGTTGGTATVTRWSNEPTVTIGG